ncbi:hypothetical protein LJB42_002517 [Komagataella kurtzmanii]|nr:hypothetical protein LJB42_002517 [Komagataella kurtzmanii]
MEQIDNHNLYQKGKLFTKKGLVEISNLAWWSVSSYKHNNGLKELREDNPDTYWQSDGNLPHSLKLHFSKKVSVERISLFTNYQLDESYSPQVISVYSGNGEHDLIKVATCELVEPIGWSHIIFNGVREDGILNTFFIKLSFESNHQSGKDTHIRSLKVFSPRNIVNKSDSTDLINCEVKPTSIRLISESGIR